MDSRSLKQTILCTSLFLGAVLFDAGLELKCKNQIKNPYHAVLFVGDETRNKIENIKRDIIIPDNKQNYDKNIFLLPYLRDYSEFNLDKLGENFT